MEWGFILAILSRLGFHSSWINWVRIYVSSSSFLVLLNGSPYGHFYPSRGLRQGDPLSPFLFILGIEVLPRLMFREKRARNLKGLHISKNSPPIHQLLFADDLLIFGKASFSVACCIRNCLVKYCLWSGQSINNTKSSIRFSKNTNPSTSSTIQNILPFSFNPTNSIYLGLPIFVGNSKIAAFQSISDRVLKRIEGWCAKTLSQVGRLVLVKSLAAAIPFYAMSSFMLPSSLCSSLDRMFKKIWWGFPSKKTKNLSFKSWDSLCLPKDQGSLGFRKMKEVNLALISKLGWKLHTNFNSAWLSQLQGKYLSLGSFLPPRLPFLLLLGSGKESLKLNPLSLSVPAKESTKTFLFLFGPHLGFLLSQIFCLLLLVS